MNVKITHHIYFLGFLIMLTACNKASETPTSIHPTVVDLQINDGGLFSGVPCGPPCFLGIRPDATSYDDMIGILSENQDLNYCKEYDNTDDGGDRGVKCANSYIISFDREKTVVTSLAFTPDVKIRLQEVLKAYGEPAGISVSTGGYAKTVSKALLFYPQYTMSITLEEQDGDAYLVQPGNKVDMIGYEGESSFQKSVKFAQEWFGYGKYIMQYK